MPEKKHRHEHHGGSSRQEMDASRIMKRLGPGEGDAMLDVGCGDGYFSVGASPIVGPAGTVYALDNYGESIDALKRDLKEKGISNVFPLQFDATLAVPLQPRTVDFVLMANVLHGFTYNDELEDVMRVLTPTLKGESRLLVIEFGESTDGKGPPEEVRLTPRRVAEVLKHWDYVVERTEPVSEKHYGLLLRRLSTES